jgi:hypothetical protein
MNKVMIRLLLVPAIAGFASCLAAAGESTGPASSSDGLQLVEKDRRGEIYANPDVDWSVYTKILLEPATVAFRRNWQRDQNRYDPFKVRAKDVEDIKTNLSQLFGEVFTKELTKDNGYTMVTDSGPEVLTIQPAIVDLDINAPDTNNYPGRVKQYTDTAGEMTLKLELYDSVTGELLATASDRRQSPYRGYPQWTTSVSNRADAQRMLQQWAVALRERLDQARTNPGPVADTPL